MKVRILALAALFASQAGCFLMGGGGGGGGAWKPDSCIETQFGGDLSGAKTGQWVAYVTEAGGSKMTTKIIVVGDGWVEWWMEGAMTYGHLFEIKDKKIVNAWAAAKDDKEWTKIKVNPAPTGGGDAPKPTIKESDESKEVKAGKFACHRMDVTVNVQGKDYKSTSWYSKDASRLYAGTEHGGLVAMEAEGSKTWFDAKGEDGKATIEMPKK
jgi:hypothetical protein